MPDQQDDLVLTYLGFVTARWVMRLAWPHAQALAINPDNLLVRPTRPRMSKGEMELAQAQLSKFARVVGGRLGRTLLRLAIQNGGTFSY